MLKKKEIKKGFSEAVTDRRDKNKKISFFNLGPKNNWKKILDENLKDKIEQVYKNELRELNYF